MVLSVFTVDYAPGELYEQTPFKIKLLRQVPGSDRPDYWIGELFTPLRWVRDGHESLISHVVVAARWVGTSIQPNARDLPIGISYVIDSTVLTDETLDFKKCAYVAIGVIHEIEGTAAPNKLTKNPVGVIGRFFGLGNKTDK